MPPPLSTVRTRIWRGQRPTGAALLACLFLVCGLAVSACACSLPVFRFALDRWSADTFRLFVSEEDATDTDVAKFLRNFGSDSGLNLEIQRTAQGPSRMLRPSHGDSAETPLWQGKVREPWLRTLGESPASTEIVHRLLEGDSAVWVLVESGNPQTDEAAATLVGKRLAYLQQAIQIPPADPNDLSSRPGPGPELTVRFSLVRIHPAADAAEDAEGLLRATLAGPQSGLSSPGKAWFAVVFGRGRVLGAWPAQDFGNEQIDEICIFLSGACSCQVKRQNPGWDLLLNVDWEERLRTVNRSRTGAPSPASPSPAPLPEAGQPDTHSKNTPASQPETVRFDPAGPDTPGANPQSTPEPPKRSTPPRIVALPLAAISLLLFTIANRRRLKKAFKK